MTTAILAIETATDACSAALFLDGEITTRFEIAPQRHTQLILPMCDDLLREAGISPKQLSAIAFGRGPGSFTGVRIAAAAAQGFAVAHDLPVIAISSLSALAYGAYLKYHVSYVLAGMDARMGEIYWGAYECLADGENKLLGQEIVGKAEKLILPEINIKNWFGVGPAWASYADGLQKRFSDVVSAGIDPLLFPSAQAVLALALPRWVAKEVISAEEISPVYLRDNVVHG